jgi:hypothetical protein
MNLNVFTGSAASADQMLRIMAQHSPAAPHETNGFPRRCPASLAVGKGKNG